MHSGVAMAKTSDNALPASIHMPGPVTFTERLGRWVSAPFFLITFATGFGLCCLLGRMTEDLLLFEPFVRFHGFINPETFFQPTAMQVRQLILATPQSKILIVVGGSSRMYGVGQRASAVWSRSLHDLLGEQYFVLNLALPAGAWDQFGMHGVEMALREGRKVIYVADSPFAVPVQPFGIARPYRYFYFEAAAHNLLLPNEPRRRALGWHLLKDSSEDQIVEDELYLRGTIDGITHFASLWTSLGYNYIFLPSWSAGTRSSPFQARRNYPDGHFAPPEGWYGVITLENGLASLRSAISGYNQVITVDGDLRFDIIPSEVRRRTVLVSLAFSPYYTGHLSDAERDGLSEMQRRTIAMEAEAGMTMLKEGDDWPIDYYVDLVHMSETGGTRLARDVAPLVRDLSARLGYLP